MRKIKKLVSTLLVGAMVSVSLMGCGGSGSEKSTTPTVAESKSEGGKAANASNPVAGKKVAYIMIMPSATIFQMWKDSCKKLCDALDVQFDFFFCDGDFNKWQDTIRTCASAGYDGLIVSHGNQDGSYVFLK